MTPSSSDLAFSRDPQALALQGLDMPRLYFVAEAPIETRSSLDRDQCGLCVYSATQCDVAIFNTFVRSCAKTALSPVQFSAVEYRAFAEDGHARRLALRRLVLAGAQVPVYTHVGTAQAAIRAQAQARRRALEQEAAEVAALIGDQDGH